MFLDRLKLVSCDRASKIAGVDSSVITKAIETYSATNGRRGLAYIVLPKRKRKLIRLCAIDDWLSRMEDDSRYVPA